MKNLIKKPNLENGFSQLLQDQVNGFSRFNNQQKLNLVKMIIEFSSTKKRQHSFNSESFSYTSVELNKLFGRSKFNKLIRKTTPTLIIKTTNYNPSKNSTCGYKVTAEAKHLLLQFLGDYLFELIEQPNNLDFQNNDTAIRSRDKNSNNTKCSFQIKNLLKVNRKNLIHIALMAKTDFHADIDKSTRVVVNAILLIEKLDRNNCIKSYYQEAASGRLYGEGFHLQFAPKEVRNASLEGYWDYDFANCHYSIIYQLGLVQNLELRSVKQYLDNKDITRTLISKQTGIDKGTVKQALISLLYGAKLTTYKNNKLYQLIGATNIQKFVKNPTVKALVIDINKVKNTIIKSARTNGSNIINDMKKSIGKDAKPSKILSHILQGLEAKLLNIVGNLYPNQLVLLMHDGWVANEKLNAELIEMAIFNEIGLEMKIEEKQIEFKFPELQQNIAA